LPAAETSKPDVDVFEKWLLSLRERDPKLHAELIGDFESRYTTLSVAHESAEAGVATMPAGLVLETLVRRGRPALLVKENRIVPVDPEADVSREVLERLQQSTPVLESVIPLVGRIDVTNHAGGLDYVGTGWLVEADMVVTNRHVAELVAQWDGRQYMFRPGRFGDPISVSIDYRHELGVDASSPAEVSSVLWIESDSRAADIAMLRVARRTDGTHRQKIDLADSDVLPNTAVAVIGYPARSPDVLIPDQAWMERVYGGHYDVKRVAPGLIGTNRRGWQTHDCTTLGGNSGSVVVDMQSGRAVALHFAGLYMIENYCIPASTLRRYRDNPPLRPFELRARATETASAFLDPPPVSQLVQAIAAGNVTITVPLTVTVSLGAPLATPQIASPSDATPKSDEVIEAARALQRAILGDGVLAVRHGYLVEGGRLSDTRCLVVAAAPTRLEDVRARAPREYAGFPVDVRQASIRDQIGESSDAAEEAPRTIAYDDVRRRGAGFSFDWVEEEMKVLLHVGPERSWSVLSDFLAKTRRRLRCSMYEFHAGYIADALQAKLQEEVQVSLVLAPQTRLPASGRIGDDDFDRAATFSRWESGFGDRFERIFVPVGNGGLVANAYHIKVAVRDGDTFWLSSGNWKHTSQPNIAEADLNDPRATSNAGNREWHVVVANKTLADRYENHIETDFEQCSELGGTPEAVEEPIYIDIPAAVLEGVERERVAQEIFVPKQIRGTIRVKPLLTPYSKGAVYCSAVIEMIRSAKKQLLFQNQYINVADTTTGLFSDLVDALVDKSNEIGDVRIILRSGGDGFLDSMAELRRRGMDVNRCVRRLAGTHTKGIIADGRQVLIGSQNWSSLGVTLNRDASLLFDNRDVAQYFAEVFEEDWRRSSDVLVPEVAFSVARVAEGVEPPPGFMRVPLADYLEG
jgi:hypothetical protein